ncbi:MAG: ATP-binding protein [Desulfocapsaceae bacterium]|nr:ATP-binding protein [Desulfocapsaceae bacterium]
MSPPEQYTILAISLLVSLLLLSTNSFHAVKDEKSTLRVIFTRKVMTAKDLPDNKSLPPGPFILFSVSDTEQDMNQKTTAHIFGPYFTTKERGRGTGLGLTIVHGIIEGFKGFIQGESKPEHGCTFRAHIPALAQDII